MGDHILIRPDSDDYPVGLRDLETPPSVFVNGRLEEATGVAIVGTRRSTRYGMELARSFGMAIAGAGWTTVSGLARGIDAASHEGTLQARGHAVAVLGCGIDVVYPVENRGLHFEIVASGGALLSEYPPGTPPDRWRFPARNRLIAALSAAVVVVEAGEKGGALITARLGAEMGRPVLAVPGDVDRPASVGCNKLIRDGAYPVLGGGDLLEELSLLIGEPPARKTSNDETPAIPGHGLSFDQLVSEWGCSPSEALARVGRLEAEGMLRRQGDRFLPT